MFGTITDLKDIHTILNTDELIRVRRIRFLKSQIKNLTPSPPRASKKIN